MSGDEDNDEPTETLSLDAIANANNVTTSAGFVVTDGPIAGSKYILQQGKSSLGRLGLLVHATAGYVDPGWKGKLTMELSNVSNLPIKLYYNMKIGQLSFFELSTPAENPYGSSFIQSKYQNQEGPTASKGYTDYQ